MPLCKPAHRWAGLQVKRRLGTSGGTTPAMGEAMFRAKRTLRPRTPTSVFLTQRRVKGSPGACTMALSRLVSRRDTFIISTSYPRI